MDIRFSPESLGLGAYQSALAIVATLILAWLVWRALRAVMARSRNKSPLTQRELVTYVAPPFAWLVVMVVAAIAFSTMQAYGPRVAIPKTKLTPIGTDGGTPGKVRDVSPTTLTDEERLKQQRQLERETKERVNLPK